MTMMTPSGTMKPIAQDIHYGSRRVNGLNPVVAQTPSDGTPIREVPPEIDVSPEPTPPAASTTRRPTRRPSRAPLPAPTVTDAPTKTPSFDAPSPSPTRRPSEAPTIAEKPSPAPTPSPITPTEAPTRPPQPTRSPTSRPSRSPTPRPTTARPSKAPSTKRPTKAPTPRPKLTPPPIDYTQRPTMATAPSPSAPFPASVPIEFQATVQAPTYQTPQQLAASCERIWETYLAARLRASYRQSTDAQPRGVDLVVSLPGNKRRRYLGSLGNHSWLPENSNVRLWLRRRLQTQTVDLKALGTAEFLVNGSSTMTPDEFSQSAQQAMVPMITQESLQQALTLGGNDATVTSVTNSLNATTDSDTSETNQRPNARRITIGFLLLILTLLSLVFWARVFYKKHQKARKQKRLAKLRQAQSKVARPPPPSAKGTAGRTAARAASTLYPVLDPLPTAKEESSSDASSSYPGLDSLSEADDDENDSDPFARELEEAVSIDQMAWTELLQQQQKLETASRELSPPSSWNNLNRPAAEPTRRVFNVSARGQEDEPTIQRISSFPYGDENDTSFLHHDDLELSLNDAVGWTSDGVTLNVIPRTGDAMAANDDSTFEPYGDTRPPTSSPARYIGQYATSSEKASRYSFVYPLKKQELSDSSQASGAGQDQEWMEDAGEADYYPSRDFEDMLNELSSDDSDNDVDPGDMMKEVARLSDYVKRYGQKKELEKSMRDEAETSVVRGLEPNPLLERLEQSRATSPRRTGPSRSDRDFAGAPFTDARRRNELTTLPARNTQLGFFRQAAAFLRNDRDVNLEAASLENEAASDDEDTGRLGIGRFTVQKPPSHLLALRPGPTSVTPDGSEDSDVEPDPTPTSTASSRPGPDTAVGKTPPRTGREFSRRLARSVSGSPDQRGVDAVSKSTAVSTSTTALFPVVKPAADPETQQQRGVSAFNRQANDAVRRRMEAKTSSAAVNPISTAGTDMAKSSALVQPVKGVAAVPVATTNSSLSNAPSDEATPSTQSKAVWKPPSPRSKNPNFNNILSMFESKPKNAPRPLSENWQYNGASPRNSTK